MSAALADSPLGFGMSEAPGKRWAMALTVLVHGVLALFLFYGVSWQTKSPQTVQVSLVTAVSPALTSAKPRAPEPAPEPKPVQKVEPKIEPKIEPRPEPKPTPKPPIKPDIAVKEKIKPEPKPEPKVDPLQKKLDEELKKLDQSKRASEKNKLNAALDKELADAKASNQAASANAKAIDRWIGQIQNKVRGNIVLPPGVRGNPEATFKVVQLPSGEILSVSLAKSSGHPGLDAAIERAILKSSPLPKPEQAALFERDLNLVFRPLEN
jgi:colicin import membrane protein